MLEFGWRIGRSMVCVADTGFIVYHYFYRINYKEEIGTLLCIKTLRECRKKTSGAGAGSIYKI
jgi:hypothetical protein